MASSVSCKPPGRRAAGSRAPLLVRCVNGNRHFSPIRVRSRSSVGNGGRGVSDRDGPSPAFARGSSNRRRRPMAGSRSSTGNRGYLLAGAASELADRRASGTRSSGVRRSCSDTQYGFPLPAFASKGFAGTTATVQLMSFPRRRESMGFRTNTPRKRANRARMRGSGVGSTGLTLEVHRTRRRRRFARTAPAPRTRCAATPARPG